MKYENSELLFLNPMDCESSMSVPTWVFLRNPALPVTIWSFKNAELLVVKIFPTGSFVSSHFDSRNEVGSNLAFSVSIKVEAIMGS